jgi:Cu(I)/Ag(I) efflux system protein CusF
MPAMTMVFRVQDAAMLGQVKAGDKIRSEVDKVKRAYTVLRVEPVKKARCGGD